MAGTLRVGLAGIGAAGSRIFDSIPKVPQAKLTAVADPRSAAREQAQSKYGVEAFESLDDMARSNAVDAIYIATPSPLHFPHALTALEHGKHVMVTKPLSLRLDHCETLIAAADANKRQLMVADTRSFNPPIRKMREIISAGELGEVFQISIWHYSPWLVQPRDPHELDSSEGGGVCFRQAPHLVDMARLIGGGRARSVRANVGRHDPNNPTEGDYTAFLDFENGATASISYNGYGYFDSSELTWAFGAGGERPVPGGGGRIWRQAMAGGITKDDKRERAVGPAQERSDGGFPYFGLFLVSCERGDMRQSTGGVAVYGASGVREVPCPAWGGSMKVELEDLCQAIAAGKPVPQDGRWGMATLEVCLQMLESSREHREMPLMHQVPSPF
jgi:phthalate 4,5-cis-dihydrodiol dehydrogenase